VRTLISILVVLCLVSAVQAIDTTDPTLRVWLDAADLAQGGVGSEVLLWQDKSSYGTRFEPRPEWDEAPHFQMPMVNGAARPSVQFEAAGDMSLPGSRDNLWQTNNKGDGINPGRSGPGDEFTLYAVAANSAMEGWLGPVNTVFSFRGTGNSPWMLGVGAGGWTEEGAYNVEYDATCVYPSHIPWLDETFSVAKMRMNAANQVWFEVDVDGSSDVSLISSAVLDMVGRNGPDIVYNYEGMAIGTHDQDCCGRGEGFAGYISEIILYARELSPEEDAAIVAYLQEKYFIPEPATMSLLGLGMLLLRRKH
jgi:hypothetical protein